MLGKGSLASLYSMSMHALAKSAELDASLISDLPGFVKDDFMRVSTLRGKCHQHVTSFLHPLTRSLDISGFIITDEDLLEVSKCLHLRVLEMNAPKYSRFDHSTSTLEVLFSRLHNLRKVEIQRNDGVTDNVISVMAASCPSLQELDVSGCSNLTDASLAALSTLAHIAAADFSSTDVTDVGLSALSKGNCSTSLTELKLNNCIKVSDQGINALIKNCKRLSKLIFCGCPKVSVDCQLALDALLNEDRNTKIVTWSVYF